jgi:hypothetical protein
MPRNLKKNWCVYVHEKRQSNCWFLENKINSVLRLPHIKYFRTRSPTLFFIINLCPFLTLNPVTKIYIYIFIYLFTFSKNILRRKVSIFFNIFFVVTLSFGLFTALPTLKSFISLMCVFPSIIVDWIKAIYATIL